MELKLHNEDLKPEYRSLNTSQTKFIHFSVPVKRAIRAVGKGLYATNGNHNAIYPPEKQKK